MPADAPRTDHAQRFAVQLDAAQAGIFKALQSLIAGVTTTDVARHGQHQAKGVLCDHVRAVVRHVADDHAPRLGSLQIDVVVASRSGDDQLEPGAGVQHASRHPPKLVAHQQHVSILSGRNEFLGRPKRRMDLDLKGLELDGLPLLKDEIDKGKLHEYSPSSTARAS